LVVFNQTGGREKDEIGDRHNAETRKKQNSIAVQSTEQGSWIFGPAGMPFIQCQNEYGEFDNENLTKSKYNSLFLNSTLHGKIFSTEEGKYFIDLRKESMP